MSAAHCFWTISFHDVYYCTIYKYQYKLKKVRKKTSSCFSRFRSRNVQMLHSTVKIKTLSEGCRMWPGVRRRFFLFFLFFFQSEIPLGSFTRLIGCDMTSHTETQFQDQDNIMNTLKPKVWWEDLQMAKQFWAAVRCLIFTTTTHWSSLLHSAL